MEQYISKDAIEAELKDLYEDIDKCIGDLVLARSKHDQRGISDVHWKMETLMVNTQQVLSYILQYLEVKEIQEEPVSEDLEEVSKKYSSCIYLEEVLSDDDKEVLKERLINTFKAGVKWQKEKEEPINEDLGLYINELSKQFPEVSFAKLSRIAVRVAKWQKEHLALTWEDIRDICRMWIESKTPFGVTGEALSIEVLNRFNKQKGE